MAALQGSVVSYSKFTAHGQKTYHGVTNGALVRDIIETYHPSTILDPMSGSGTVLDVARDCEIPALGYDIINGHNILKPATRKLIKDDVMKLTNSAGVDMIWWDPPYYNMVQYSPDPDDFSNGPYSLFLQRMQSTLIYLGTLLSNYGFIALELGDLRRPHPGFQNRERVFFITDDVMETAKIREAKLWKEFRYINWFTPAIRNPESYVRYLKAMCVKPGDAMVDLCHESITILRSTRCL